MRVKVKANFRELRIDDMDHQDLTPSKEYDVDSIEYDDFRIAGESGEPCLYPAGIFDLIDPAIPSGWIVEFDEEGLISIGPPEFLARGFWEDFFDHKPSAKETYQLVKQRFM